MEFPLIRKGTHGPHARYFFDDKEDNIRPFAGTDYNALQVSCNSRALSAKRRGEQPSFLVGGSQWVLGIYGDLMECL